MSRETATPGHRKFRFHHTFLRPARTISAEGCAHSQGTIALSRLHLGVTRHTHDLRRGLRVPSRHNRISRLHLGVTRHARSPQRVARAAKTQSHFSTYLGVTRHARSPQRVARTAKTTIALSRCISRISTRTISAEGCAHSRDTFALSCLHLGVTRHARSPQRVARGPQDKSHSRLHFVPSTRTISAEGCAHSRQVALSPAFRALDTHDLRRGLRGQPANRTLATFRALARTISAEGCARTGHNRTLACISRTPGATISAEGCAGTGQICISRLHFAHSTRTISAEGCARQGTSHSRLHFAHSTRTISAEGCSQPANRTLAAFRALDTHDLRRGLRADRTNRTLACISRTRHARSPQRVARGPGAFALSRLRFGRTRSATISAEGCARTQDTHSRRDLRISRTFARRPARSPQRVACTQDTFAFHDTFGRPGTQDLRRGLLAPKTHLHFTTQLGLPAGEISAEACSDLRHVCISRHIWASRHTRSPQRVACTQGTFALHDTFGRPGTQDLRKGLLAPKTHLHLFHDTFGRPASTISTEGCVL